MATVLRPRTVPDAAGKTHQAPTPSSGQSHQTATGTAAPVQEPSWNWERWSVASVDGRGLKENIFPYVLPDLRSFKIWRMVLGVETISNNYNIWSLFILCFLLWALFRK